MIDRHRNTIYLWLIMLGWISTVMIAIIVDRCTTSKPLPLDGMSQIEAYRPIITTNGCVIDSINFVNTFKTRNILNDSSLFNRIVTVSYVEGGIRKAHAVVLFEYHDRYWVYDSNEGTYPVNIDEPTLGKLINNLRIKGRITELKWI